MTTRTYGRRANDQRIADDSTADRELMCHAEGCPNRWSVQREGDRGLCSAHAWAKPALWPIITHEQQAALLQRRPAPAEGETRRDPKRLAEVLSQLRQPSDPRAWIERLQARERAGERLNQAQRETLRAALQGRSISVDESPDDIARRDDEKRSQAERVREYAEQRGIAL